MNSVSHDPIYLVTGAGGGVGGVSRLVVEQLVAQGQAVRAMVHREDARAETLRELGAQVVVGDLTNPVDVAAAMSGIARMFFNMSVSPSTWRPRRRYAWPPLNSTVSRCW